MITLPDDHNHTTRRFKRSQLQAWQGDHAACIERPRTGVRLHWPIVVPIVLGVLVLALLLQVKERVAERRAVIAACEATQAVDDPLSPCRRLYSNYLGGR